MIRVVAIRLVQWLGWVFETQERKKERLSLQNPRKKERKKKESSPPSFPDVPMVRLDPDPTFPKDRRVIRQHGTRGITPEWVLLRPLDYPCIQTFFGFLDFWIFGFLRGCGSHTHRAGGRLPHCFMPSPKAHFPKSISVTILTSTVWES